MRPVSIAFTDALLSVAATGLYAPKWTREIEREWIQSLEHHRPALKGKLDKRRDAMRSAVPNWEIEESAWRSVKTLPVMPDQSDAHVLAAAIVGHADCIVTLNLKDFPDALIKPVGIEAIDPDVFLLNQWDLNPDVVLSAFRAMRYRRFDPAQNPDEFIASIERSGMSLIADRLRAVARLL